MTEPIKENVRHRHNAQPKLEPSMVVNANIYAEPIDKEAIMVLHSS